jgi:hypothetical protein
VILKSVFGARLCPQGQPQRGNYSAAFGLTGVLRLAFDTAALHRSRTAKKSARQPLASGARWNL